MEDIVADRKHILQNHQSAVFAEVCSRNERTAELYAQRAELSRQIPDFWLRAFSNAHETIDLINSGGDRRILSELMDVRAIPIQGESSRRGMRLEFEFTQESGVSPSVLWREDFVSINDPVEDGDSDDEEPESVKKLASVNAVEAKFSAAPWRKSNKGGGKKGANVDQSGSRPKGYKDSFFSLFFPPFIRDGDDVSSKLFERVRLDRGIAALIAFEIVPNAIELALGAGAAETDGPLVSAAADELRDLQQKISGVLRESERIVEVHDTDLEQKMQRLYTRRASVAASIPGFWLSALRANSVIQPFARATRDKAALNCITDIRSNITGDSRRRRIELTFELREQKWMEKTELKLACSYASTGETAVERNGVSWKEGKCLTSKDGHSSGPRVFSFFCLFEKRSLVTDEEVAAVVETVHEDLIPSTFSVADAEDVLSESDDSEGESSDDEDQRSARTRVAVSGKEKKKRGWKLGQTCVIAVLVCSQLVGLLAFFQ